VYPCRDYHHAMTTRRTVNQSVFLAAFFVAFFVSAVETQAVRQVLPVDVDGHFVEIDPMDSVSQVAAPHSSGTTQSDLLHLRVSNDDSSLYVGVGARLPVRQSSSGLILLFDAIPGGADTLKFADHPNVPEALRDFEGVRFEQDFYADGAVSFTPNQSGGAGYEVFYHDFRADVSRLSVIELGLLVFGPTGASSFIPQVHAPAVQIAWDGSEYRSVKDSRDSQRGLELSLPLSLVRSGQTWVAGGDSAIQVFAASLDLENRVWSNHTLPPSVGAGDSVALGGKAHPGGMAPDFRNNTRGSLPSPDLSTSQPGAARPLHGHQSLSSALPVRISAFDLEQ
jgi:hypothetical protein